MPWEALRSMAKCRSLGGDARVDDGMTTDASIVAGTTAALSTDSRIKALIVGVLDERGVVTLKGQVADPNTWETAEETARRQPGVVDVINELEVKIDDVTELLQFRAMLWEQRIDRPWTKPDRVDD